MLSSVGRADYRLAEADLKELPTAFKEAGELEYMALLVLTNLPEFVQACLNLSQGGASGPWRLTYARTSNAGPERSRQKEK